MPATSSTRHDPGKPSPDAGQTRVCANRYCIFDRAPQPLTRFQKRGSGGNRDAVCGTCRHRAKIGVDKIKILKELLLKDSLEKSPTATKIQARVPKEPFCEWWGSLPPVQRARVFAKWDGAHQTVRRVFASQGRISYWTVDKFGVLADDPGLASRLYPDVFES